MMPPRNTKKDDLIEVGEPLTEDETSLKETPAKKGKALFVLSPFVWYREEVENISDPRADTIVVQHSAHDGQIIPGENLIDGERERLLALRSDGYSPDVIELDEGATVPPPRRMVGVGTGNHQSAQAAAIQAAAARAMAAITDRVHPDDPEYEDVTQQANLLKPDEVILRVPAGPGGYNEDAVKAANPGR